MDVTTQCYRTFRTYKEPINQLTFLSNSPDMHCKKECLEYLKHTLSSCPLPSPDVNDNVPFFTSSIYEASVTEGAESVTLVFQVSANDLDLGLNGKVKTDLWCLELISFSMHALY